MSDWVAIPKSQLTRHKKSVKGLYINYVILFWTILDTPLPPVIMSSFDIPPTSPDDAIYVQDNH